jgi:hypothetical protein
MANDWEEPLGVGDPDTHKLRMLAHPCTTCITRPAGERIQLSNRRVGEFIAETRRRESYVICHMTLPGNPAGALPAICRGFYDRYSTNALRMGERLLGFTEVPDPSATKEKEGRTVANVLDDDEDDDLND